MSSPFFFIDNSGRSVIEAFYHNLKTMVVTITCDISNKSLYLYISLSLLPTVIL